MKYLVAIRFSNLSMNLGRRLMRSVRRNQSAAERFPSIPAAGKQIGIFCSIY